MEHRTFDIVAGVVFALVALAHLMRVYLGWPAVIGGWSVPMWVSWIAIVVSGGLAYFGLRFGARRQVF